MRRPTPIGSAAAQRTRLRSAATMTGLAAAAFAVLHRLGRTWGSTRRERGTRMPGDEIVRKPFGATMHAVSIDAPPERVWPWLVQMGYHRGGWGLLRPACRGERGLGGAQVTWPARVR
jgi:hypothetical protein